MAFPKFLAGAVDGLASGPGPPSFPNITFGPLPTLSSLRAGLPGNHGMGPPRELCMKLKIGVYLTSNVAKQLKLAIKRSRATKSDIVNEALARFLNPAPETDPGDGVLQRLDLLAKRIRLIQRDLDIFVETLLLHVQQFLMITPPVPESEQHDAKTRGRERYEVFIAQIAKRIASGEGMVAEIMEGIAETHRGRFASPMSSGAMHRGTSQPLEPSHG